MPAHEPFFLGVDAGASRCRCVVLASQGRLVGWADGLGSAYHPHAPDRCLRTIVACVREAAAALQLPAAGLGLGVAGLGRPAPRHWFLQALRRFQLAKHIVATHDAEIALWGAMPGGSGVVVIAGTGAIAYGRTAQGREARAGGWGREIDDEGGGWWLGREALAAVARAHDGRGPQTALTALLLAATGCPAPPQLIDWVRSPERTPAEIAALSLQVERAAQQGDQVARSLLRRAGQALADMLAACARQLGEEVAPQAALVGGLAAQAPSLRRCFAAAARRRMPSLALIPARLPAVLGAVIKLWRVLRRPVDEALLATLEEQAKLLPQGWGY
jgi:N-acetylglucosamine kinase-like BadF-type ATPase